MTLFGLMLPGLREILQCILMFSFDRSGNASADGYEAV